jgi:tetratricopeptide (TPR) repeat protein
MKTHRNNPCPCRSGKKYKKCCSATDELNNIVAERMNFKIKDFMFAIEPDIEDDCRNAIEQIIAGKHVTAKRTIMELYNEKPHNYMVNYAVAVSLLHEKKISEAKLYLNKSIDINPLFGQAHYNLGVIYAREEGDLCNAARHIKKALEFEKPNTEVAQAACKMMRLLETSTQELYGCSLEEYIRGEEFYNMALDHVNKRDYRSAIALFERALAINPKHLPSHGNMGIACAYIGDTQRALECFDKALALDPTYVPALINRATIASLPKNTPLPHDTEVIDYNSLRE